MSPDRRSLLHQSKRERPFPHGTTNGYGNLGCRCHDCRAANAAAQREYKARRQQRHAPRPAAVVSRHPRGECGRPYDVLRYIDYCLDPKRPLVMDVNGGAGEMRRALREAEAGLRAAAERLRNAYAAVDAQRKLVEALEELDRVHV